MAFGVSLSVIVPAYNEEGIISTCLNNLDRVLNALSGRARFDSEIVVVDDGSMDNTYSAALNTRTISRTKVIRCTKNCGKGSALRKGFLASSGDIVLFIDADIPVNYSMIASFTKKIEQADIVIGSKWLPGSKNNYSVRRRIFSSLFHSLVTVTTGLSFADTQCGLKAFKRNALADLVPQLKIDRWAYDVELLASAQSAGFKIVEIPVTFNNRDRTMSFSEMLKMGLDIFVFSYRYRLRS